MLKRYCTVNRILHHRGIVLRHALSCWTVVLALHTTETRTSDSSPRSRPHHFRPDLFVLNHPTDTGDAARPTQRGTVNILRHSGLLFRRVLEG